jgi:RNA polymerase sigma factor (sigma-70 family)
VRGQAEADDVVAESFAKLLDLFRRGGGPEDAFRPYLLTTIRRTAYDRHRAERRQVTTDDAGVFDAGIPFADPAVEGLERSMIARAFASLPERWQAVLWHTEIEGERPAEVASLLGLTPNGVAALAYRAREGLRQAYLQMHLSSVARPGCRPVATKLGAYVRGGLAKRDAATVGSHLDQCEECRILLAELGDVNVALKGIVGPLVLGAAATSYLGAGGGSVTGWAGGWLAGRLTWFRRAPRGQQVAAAGFTAAVVGGFAVMALAVVANTGHGPGASPPPGRPAAAAAPAGAGRAQSAGHRAGTAASGAITPGVTPARTTLPGTPPLLGPGPSPSAAATTAPHQSRTGPAQGQQKHKQSGNGQRTGQVVPSSTVPGLSTPALAGPGLATVTVPSLTPQPGRTTAAAVAPRPRRPRQAARPARRPVLALRINPVGTLNTGGTGSVAFSVANTGSAATPQVNATITLPRGVSYATAGTLGMDSGRATGPSGWTCQPTDSGAVCTHGPLAAGASTTGYLPVFVANDATTGAPPALSVSAGSQQASARGTQGVAGPGWTAPNAVGQPSSVPAPAHQESAPASQPGSGPPGDQMGY